MNLAALRKECAELVEADKKFWDEAGDNLPTGAKADEVKDRNKRIEELEHQIADAMEAESLRLKNQERQKRNTQSVNSLETPLVPEEKNKRESRIESLGDQFVDSQTFKQWHEQILYGGSVTSVKFGTSPRVELKTLITGTSATSAGAIVTPDQLGLRDQGLFMRPLTIIDLITVGTTTSDSVEYARVGTVANNAAPVAEATAASGGSGAKPESGFALSVETANVKTIAHWIPVTRRALSDAAQIRTMIDAFLRYGLEEELEDQVVAGGGTGENLLGIRNTPNLQTQAFATDIIVTSRKARTKVKVGGRATPTAYAFHPNDWEAFDLMKDGEQRYYFGGPSVLGTPRLWGLPVVETEALTQGVGMVADWRWAVLWNRMQATITLSDSHSDFFTRNLVAILAELRAAFGLVRPQAFCEIDLTA